MKQREIAINAFERTCIKCYVPDEINARCFSNPQPQNMWLADTTKLWVWLWYQLCFSWCNIPSHCSYLLMLKCWTDVPSDRPTFQEISEEIKQFTTAEESNDVSQPLQTKVDLGESQEYLGVMGWRERAEGIRGFLLWLWCSVWRGDNQCRSRHEWNEKE